MQESELTEIIPLICTSAISGLPDSSVGKESICNAGDPGSIPGSGRSTGQGTGYPLQYSGLKNSMVCIVHGVAKSRTRLSNFHFTSLSKLGPVSCSFSFTVPLRFSHSEFPQEGVVA